MTLGFYPVQLDAAEGLYRIVDAAYERRSVAVSSNLHPSGFNELMPKTLASATVDRLMHHAHVCVTSGDSVRLQQATAGKGVKPLPSCWTAGLVAVAARVSWPRSRRSGGRQRAELNDSQWRLRRVGSPGPSSHLRTRRSSSTLTAVVTFPSSSMLPAPRRPRP
jgi:hypothetical protein